MPVNSGAGPRSGSSPAAPAGPSARGRGRRGARGGARELVEPLAHARAALETLQAVGVPGRGGGEPLRDRRREQHGGADERDAADPAQQRGVRADDAAVAERALPDERDEEEREPGAQARRRT